MTATSSIPEAAIAAATEMPRLEDGYINLQEVPRRLAESIVNGVTDAEADQLCEATGNSRNGYRERMLVTCVSALALRVPKLLSGTFSSRTCSSATRGSTGPCWPTWPRRAQRASAPGRSRGRPRPWASRESRRTRPAPVDDH